MTSSCGGRYGRGPTGRSSQFLQCRLKCGQRNLARRTRPDRWYVSNGNHWMRNDEVSHYRRKITCSAGESKLVSLMVTPAETSMDKGNEGILV